MQWGTGTGLFSHAWPSLVVATSRKPPREVGVHGDKQYQPFHYPIPSPLSFRCSPLRQRGCAPASVPVPWHSPLSQPFPPLLVQGLVVSAFDCKPSYSSPPASCRWFWIRIIASPSPAVFAQDAPCYATEPCLYLTSSGSIMMPVLLLLVLATAACIVVWFDVF